MNKHHHEFGVLGQKIVVKSPEEIELARCAVEIAQNKLNEIQDRSQQLGLQQLATLALVEVAGDLVRERRQMHEYREELDRKCTTLMTELRQVEEIATRPASHSALGK